MGTRNTKEQGRAYAAEARQRKRDAGLVWRGLWVHPEDWAEIADLAKRLENQRKNNRK